MLGKTNVMAISGSGISDGDFGGGIKSWQPVDCPTRSNITTCYGLGAYLVALTTGSELLVSDNGEVFKAIKIPTFENGFRILDISYNGIEYVLCGIYMDDETGLGQSFISFTSDFESFETVRKPYRIEVASNETTHPVIFGVHYQEDSVVLLCHYFYLQNTSYQANEMTFVDSKTVKKSQLLEGISETKGNWKKPTLHMLTNLAYDKWTRPSVLAKNSQKIICTSWKQSSNTKVLKDCTVYNIEQASFGGGINFTNAVSFDGRGNKYIAFEMQGSIQCDFYVDSNNGTYYTANGITPLIFSLYRGVSENESLYTGSYSIYAASSPEPLEPQRIFDPIDGVYFNDRAYIISSRAMMAFDYAFEDDYSPIVTADNVAEIKAGIVNISFEHTLSCITKAFGNIYIFGDNGYILKSSSEPTAGDTALKNYVSARGALAKAKAYTDDKIRTLEARIEALEAIHGGE